MNFPNIKPYLPTKQSCIDFCTRYKQNKLTDLDRLKISEDPTLITLCFRVADEINEANKHFDKIDFSEIEKNKETNPYSFITYKFLEAKKLVSEENYKAALDILNPLLNNKNLKYFSYAKQNILITLVLIHSELCDFYQALEKINQLKQIKDGLELATQYNKYLEAYVLIFLGYNIQLKRLIGDQDHKMTSFDLNLMIDFIENNLDSIQNVFSEAHNEQDFEKTGFNAFFDVLLGGVLISNNNNLKKLARNSWIRNYLQYNIKKYPNYTRIKLFCYLLDLENSKDFINEFKYPETIHTIIELEIAFLYLLLANKENDEIQKNNMLKLISNFCLEKRIQNPFYPFFIDGKWYPESHISIKLAEHLHLGTTAIDDEKIIVDDTSITYFKNNTKLAKIDFTKSYTSINLFKIISGPAKSEFTKCYMHETLSQTPYNKLKHDNRLYKLISRLSKILESHNIPAPWYMPKNNNLILNYRIELRL